MEKLSDNIANKISLELNLDNNRKEVIAYGTFALLQIVITLILTILFGTLFHIVIEAVIVSFSAAILRKYSGGAHASTPNNCTIIGIVMTVIQAKFIVIFVSRTFSVELISILGVIIFVWGYYIIFKLAPVDSKNKPIKKAEKRYRMRKNSIIILSLYMIINIVLTLLYLRTNQGRFLNYSGCLYVGILWQNFTLTKLGHLIINKIDKLLLIFYRR
ncbi:MAG: accessory gene regulator ArgB-like protein [Clostridiaceae bacterium]